MRIIALAGVAAALLVVPAGASGAGEWDHLLAPEAACQGQSDATLAARAQTQTMVCLHNYARAQSGLPTLHTIKKLKISANKKAHDIKRCKQFSHEACGRDAFYWLERVGFFRGASGAAENLALGSGELGSARATMTAWLNSAGHRASLLSPSFREIGIGVVRTSFSGYSNVQVWVAHLGYRR